MCTRVGVDRTVGSLVPRIYTSIKSMYEISETSHISHTRYIRIIYFRSSQMALLPRVSGVSGYEEIYTYIRAHVADYNMRTYMKKPYSVPSGYKYGNRISQRKLNLPVQNEI